MILLIALKYISLHSSLYDFHSRRRLGFSATAYNEILELLLKVHGRWATDRVKDGYIKNNIEQKLLVFINFGL